jgi:hypothetical protein
MRTENILSLLHQPRPRKRDKDPLQMSELALPLELAEEQLRNKIAAQQQVSALWLASRIKINKLLAASLWSLLSAQWTKMISKERSFKTKSSRNCALDLGVRRGSRQ